MKIGYPHVKVYAFPDYSHFLTDRHYDITDSYIKMNLRNSLTSGILNCNIILNDAYNQVGNSNEIIFRIDITSPVSGEIVTYIMGSTHNDLTIMQNGDAIRSYNLVPFHNRIPKRFSKKLTNSGGESLELLIDELYSGYDMLKPKVESPDIYIPSAVWVQTFDKFIDFINRKALSTISDDFVFCWYEGDKIKVEEFNTILNSEPMKGLFVEEKLMGTLGYLMGDVIPVLKYEYLTEYNNYNKSDKLNATYISSSYEENNVYSEALGTGDNIIDIDRSCIYREMTYANGYEEIKRLTTLNQYDSYSKFRTFGDIRIRPGKVISIEDDRGLIKHNNIVDEVVHEFSQEAHYTHVYLMSNSSNIEDLEITREVGFDPLYEYEDEYDYTYEDSGIDLDSIDNMGDD